MRQAIRRHAGLLALIAIGIALRVWATLAYQPAVLGYPDGTEYLINGASDVWRNIGRPVGFPLLISAVTTVWDSLEAIVAVQHAIGIVTAVLLYAAVLAAGAPRGVALVPAAVVLLSGDQVFAEHSPLSEPLFGALLALAFLLAVRAAAAREGMLPGRGIRLLAGAGLALGLASTVRYVGEALVAVAALWALLALAGPPRVRVLSAAALGIAAVAVVGGYVGARGLALEDSGGTRGQTGLAVPGNSMYGRVAPFADCSKFEPPAGTRALCDATPPDQRDGPGWYVFHPDAPVRTHPGAARADTDRWARAALIGQPLDYLAAVTRDVGRFAFPAWLEPEGFGWGDRASAYRFAHRRPQEEQRALAEASRLFGPVRVERAASVTALDRYQAIVRVHGGLLAIFALLAAAGAGAARGRVRAAILFALSASLGALVVSVAVTHYDARYAFPVEGLLAAAGALGAWALLGVRRSGAGRESRAGTT